MNAVVDTALVTRLRHAAEWEEPDNPNDNRFYVWTHKKFSADAGRSQSLQDIFTESANRVEALEGALRDLLETGFNVGDTPSRQRARALLAGGVAKPMESK